MTRFELGGVGTGAERTTVNIVAPADIVADIRDLDSFCADGQAELFVLVHTLEHIPAVDYAEFLRGMWRKLAPGGRVEVMHTDVGRLLEMVTRKEISLRAARPAIFVPADRLRENPHHLHHNMWSQEMLAQDFRVLGYSRVEEFDGGVWVFDMTDELFPEETERYHGINIPNLGVRAFK